MTETLWLAGMLFANLWATGGIGDLEKDTPGAAAGALAGDSTSRPLPPVVAPPALPVQKWVGDRIEERAPGDARTPILPPIKAGEKPVCENPPTQEEILRALPTVARGIPYVYEQYRDELEFTVEKLVDRVDAPRFFPLIGTAQLHHCHWKCTVYFTDVLEITYPLVRLRTRRAEVVYYDTDRLHLCEAQNKDKVAAVCADMTSEPPMNCPGGHFRPAPKATAKAEPAQQVQMEVTIVGIDRSAIPSATFRWACEKLGLQGGVGVVNHQAARDLVKALGSDGLATILAQPNVVTLSGRPAHLITGVETRVTEAGQLHTSLGTSLHLLPMVKADGKIHLEICPEITSANDAKSIRAAVTLAAGETVAILGPTYIQTTITENRLPFLGDLPGVGALFTWRHKYESDREVLVLVTPRIEVHGGTEESSEPPMIDSAPFPTVVARGTIYVVVEDGYDGRLHPIAAKEQSVLDLVAESGVAASKMKKIWVSRPPSFGHVNWATLPVDWKAITQRGRTETNFSLQDGDRLHIVLEPSEETRSQAMTINDVIKMSKAGVAQKIILRQMELTNAVFNLTADDIIQLHEQGVNSRLISAMQERREEVKLVAPPAMSKYTATHWPDAAFETPVVAPKKAITAVSRVTPFWVPEIRHVADTLNNGKKLPGLVGRLYLENDGAKQLDEAKGSIYVEMYDRTSSTPVKLADWRFDAESLKSLKKTDFVGMGYTLFLPWEGYRPEITQVEIRVLYMPEDGSQPQHAEPEIISLRRSPSESILQQWDSIGSPIEKPEGQGNLAK